MINSPLSKFLTGQKTRPDQEKISLAVHSVRPMSENYFEPRVPLKSFMHF